MILDGRRVAQKVLGEVQAGVERLRAEVGVTPMLAVVLVGDFAPSKIYVANKKKAAEAVGVATRDYVYPAGLTQRELLTLLRTLNAEDDVHGILLQLPLVEGCDEDEAIATIAPEKDVDGLHPTNLGRLLAGAPTVVPCTAAGCLEILDHYGAKLEGAEAVGIGRSRLVGKPLAQLLLAPRHLPPGGGAGKARARAHDRKPRRVDGLPAHRGAAGAPRGALPGGVGRGRDLELPPLRLRPHLLHPEGRRRPAPLRAVPHPRAADPVPARRRPARGRLRLGRGVRAAWRIPAGRRAARAQGARRAPARLRAAEGSTPGRRPLRRGSKARASEVPEADRHRHLTERRRHPGHPARDRPALRRAPYRDRALPGAGGGGGGGDRPGAP